MKKLVLIIFCLSVFVTMTVSSVFAYLVESKPYDEQFPLTDEKKTLEIFAALPGGVKDFENNDFTKWYEEKTNVHIEWDYVRENIINEKRNIMLATGEYPDILMNSKIEEGQINIYGKQGVFIPLNDLIEEHTYYLKKILEEEPWILDLITAEDGNIYNLPDINECYHCKYPQKMWIYKPWLDRLGLDMPETTEEFYQVLKAFKEEDPNGNGIADEIPLAGTPKGWRSDIDGFLICPFIYNSGSESGDRLYLDDGIVTAPFNQPGWKEGLKYLNKLYEEGLLYPESFTQDLNQLGKLGKNADVVILGAAPGGFHGSFVNYQSDRYKGYVAVPPLKGPDGNRSTFYNPYGAYPGKFIITSACKNPELAIKWIDWLFSLEGTLRSTYGIPGENWKWADDGELGINGKPAIWSPIEQEEEKSVNNYGWNQANPTNRPAEFRLGRAWNNNPYDAERVLYIETKNKYEGKELEDSYLPPLSFNDNELLEVEDMKVSINNYVEELIAAFIIGARDIDKDWDSYLNELNNIGLERYLEIHQRAYERRYGEK